jgi:hypothetical protein
LKTITALLLSSALFTVAQAQAPAPAQTAQPVAPAVVGRVITEPSPDAAAHKAAAKKQHAKAPKKTAAKKTRKGSAKKVTAHAPHKVLAKAPARKHQVKAAHGKVH